MRKSPLQIVKDRFGEDRRQAKQELVNAVKTAAGKDLWLDQVNEDKGLERVSMRKLLRLERIFSEVTEAVGSREDLIAEIAKLEARDKDEDYKTGLQEQPTPRLWDHYRSVKRRESSKRSA